MSYLSRNGIMPGHTDGDNHFPTPEGSKDSGIEFKRNHEIKQKAPMSGEGEDLGLKQALYHGQPQFSEGQRVYVSHPSDGWVTAVVLGQSGCNKVKVRLVSGQISERGFKDVLLMKSEGNDLESCSNLTDICPVNEASVLHCLCERFESDIFYTRVGTTLMALNPCKQVPNLYGSKSILGYHRQHGQINQGSYQTSGPHIYEIAERAYSAVTRGTGCVNQSVLISGESGAGKTVSTKHLLRYLAVVSSKAEKEEDPDVSIAGSAIEKRVLVSNPILEAFGNATTPRNENSSRFGKFIQLQFDRSGAMIGGVIQSYLLEKTRVAHQNYDTDDKNFHVFYQLMSLASWSRVPEWLEEVHSALCQSGLPLVQPNSHNGQSLDETIEALTDIGVSSRNQAHIFKILLAILHLGRIKFVSTCQGDASDISQADKASLKARDQCCHLLELSPMRLHQALVHRHIVSGGESRRSVFSKTCQLPEAKSRRDCLAMLLYARLFDWLVAFINHQIKADDCHLSINLLDIFGFETFQTNSLEQMCINYANERLQQFYVAHFLKDIQSEYEMEGIVWTQVAYRDNAACVSAMDSALGIFGILNEEVYLKRKSDDSVLQGRIIDSTKCTRVVFKVRQPAHSPHGNLFLVSHFAGDVVYDLADAVRKNQDNVPSEFVELLSQSTNPLVRNLFNGSCSEDMESSLPSVKNKRRKTVLTKFKLSLDDLIGHLKTSACHYIRCVKPNSTGTAGVVDKGFVLRQLQACGTLETVEICRKGYSARMLYTDFVKRYTILLPRNIAAKNMCCSPRQGSSDSFEKDVDCLLYLSHPNVTTRKTRKRRGQTLHNDYRSQCVNILLQAVPVDELNHMDRQFGQTKIFLSQTQLELLEQSRHTVVSAFVVRIQSLWKGYRQKCCYRKTMSAVKLIQARWRGFVHRRQLERSQEAVRRVQHCWRAYRMKLAWKKLSRNIRVLRRGINVWAARHRDRRQNLNFSCGANYPSRKHLNMLKSNETLDRVCGCDEIFPTQISYDKIMTAVDEFYSQETMEVSTDAGNIHRARGMKEEKTTVSNTNSVCSEDSGSMIHDDSCPSTSLPSDGLVGRPPPKKLRLGLQESLHIGNGIATCRHLTKPGYRFHTRRSVLQYGHVTHRRHLIQGLPDALGSPDGKSDKENQPC